MSQSAEKSSAARQAPDLRSTTSIRADPLRETRVMPISRPVASGMNPRA